MDSFVERCVAQDVADHDDAAVTPCLIPQCNAFPEVIGNWLFQKNMIAFFQCRQRITYVISVLCRNDQHIRKLRLRQKLLTRMEAALCQHSEAVLCDTDSIIVGICDSRNAKLIGMRKLAACVGIAAAAPKTADCAGNNGHIKSPFRGIAALILYEDQISALFIKHGFYDYIGQC